MVSRNSPATLMRPQDIPTRSDSSLTDRYRLGSYLFEDSYHRVVKCTLLSPCTKLVLNSYPKIEISQVTATRFLSELSALLLLDHPNTCKVHEYFQDSRNFYIVMERAKGSTLVSRILASDPLTEAVAAGYMQQIFSVLSHMQALHIAHRNLKPETLVFLSENSEILKLISFKSCVVLGPGQTVRSRIGTPQFMAPEVLRGKYSNTCDMWSAGVILYLLLGGSLPFTGKCQDSIMKAISLGVFEFSSPIWERVSEQAKDLIRGILVLDPSARITPEQALAHAWIRNARDEPPTREYTARYFAHLAEFNAKSIYKKSVYRYIAAFFTMSNEEEQLAQLFKFLDTDKNGLLSRQELREGSLKLFGNRFKNIDVEIDGILEKVDLDGSGQISYKEFCVAAIGRHKVLERKRLEDVFRSIDIDGNGFIDVQELRTMLGRFINDPKCIEEFLVAADTNKDGLIDVHEFIKVMRKG